MPCVLEKPTPPWRPTCVQNASNAVGGWGGGFLWTAVPPAPTESPEGGGDGGGEEEELDTALFTNVWLSVLRGVGLVSAQAVSAASEDDPSGPPLSAGGPPVMYSISADGALHCWSYAHTTGNPYGNLEPHVAAKRRKEERHQAAQKQAELQRQEQRKQKAQAEEGEDEDEEGANEEGEAREDGEEGSVKERGDGGRKRRRKQQQAAAVEEDGQKQQQDPEPEEEDADERRRGGAGLASTSSSPGGDFPRLAGTAIVRLKPHRHPPGHQSAPPRDQPPC
jgi:hypothetical protein